MMGPDGWITIGVLGGLLVILALELFSVDFIMLTALVLLVLLGVLDLETALQGFANSTLLALGSLFVMAGGLRKAGALDLAAEKLLGREKNLRRALARLSVTATTSSAFLNNTPVVAMGIPAVRNWARSRGISPSKLLIPLSYASILGGICTLIGTSTNLVTHGLLQSHGMEGFAFFELAAVGVPVALVGFLYLVFVAPNLLPEREEVREAERRERGPLLELEVEEGSTVAGKSLYESGLAALPGHSLIRVQRGDEFIGGTEVEEELSEGDILEYERVEGEEEPERAGPEGTGEALSDLTMALRPRTHRHAGADTERHEVVVREGSGLIGRTVEEVDFPERFGARVTGVRRGGARVKKPLNEIVLRLGDVLVLETGRGFRHAFEVSPQFFITSEARAPGERVMDTEREPEETGIALAGSILAVVVALAALGVV
ncbi:MAG: SLC13 family permease, partial [Longimicrobiales bacterium]